MKDRLVVYPAFWWLSFVFFMITSRAENPLQSAVFGLAFSFVVSEYICARTKRNK